MRTLVRTSWRWIEEITTLGMLFDAVRLSALSQIILQYRIQVVAGVNVFNGLSCRNTNGIPHGMVMSETVDNSVSFILSIA